MAVITAKSLGGTPEAPAPVIAGKSTRLMSLRELVEQLPKSAPARKQFEHVLALLEMSETGRTARVADPTLGLLELAGLWKLKMGFDAMVADSMRARERWVEGVCVEVTTEPE